MNGKCYESDLLPEFTRRCLKPEPWHHGDLDGFQAHWEAAEDLDAFKAAVFADDSLKHTQAYGVLSRESEGHWYRVREMFGDRQFKTESDAGGVMVGSADGSFTALISNGHGDGTTRCAVFPKDDRPGFNDSMFWECIKSTLHGKFSISSYDCGFDPVADLEGRFFVYSWEGFVAFVEF